MFLRKFPTQPQIFQCIPDLLPSIGRSSHTVFFGKSVHLCAGRDGIVEHDQMQLFFSLFCMNGGNQHAAGIDAHHLSGRKVEDGQASLADQLFRLIPGVDAGKNDPVCAGSVVQRELEKLL